MPVKRRAGKAAKRLSADHVTMLTAGPHEMLFAGCGYMEGRLAGVYDRADDAERADIDEAMRADWAIHRDRLLAEWQSEHGPVSKPWASLQFDDPAYE